MGAFRVRFLLFEDLLLLVGQIKDLPARAVSVAFDLEDSHRVHTAAAAQTVISSQGNGPST